MEGEAVMVVPQESAESQEEGESQSVLKDVEDDVPRFEKNDSEGQKEGGEDNNKGRGEGGQGLEISKNLVGAEVGVDNNMEVEEIKEIDKDSKSESQPQFQESEDLFAEVNSGNVEEQMDHEEEEGNPDIVPEDTPETPEVEDDEDEDDEEDTENEASATTQLPMARVKKIMKICVNTNEEEGGDDPPLQENRSNKKKGKGKGKKVPPKPTSSGTNNMIITKEGIYLTAAATELFISLVAQQSSRITASSKKKTMTLEHLKRALTDMECYEFLQGCFQPSIIIGD